MGRKAINSLKEQQLTFGKGKNLAAKIALNKQLQNKKSEIKQEKESENSSMRSSDL